MTITVNKVVLSNEVVFEIKGFNEILTASDLTEITMELMGISLRAEQHITIGEMVEKACLTLNDNFNIGEVRAIVLVNSAIDDTSNNDANIRYHLCRLGYKFKDKVYCKNNNTPVAELA